MLKVARAMAALAALLSIGPAARAADELLKRPQPVVPPPAGELSTLIPIPGSMFLASGPLGTALGSLKGQTGRSQYLPFELDPFLRSMRDTIPNAFDLQLKNTGVSSFKRVGLGKLVSTPQDPYGEKSTEFDYADYHDYVKQHYGALYGEYVRAANGNAKRGWAAMLGELVRDFWTEGATPNVNARGQRVYETYIMYHLSRPQTRKVVVLTFSHGNKVALERLYDLAHRNGGLGAIIPGRGVSVRALPIDFVGVSPAIGWQTVERWVSVSCPKGFPAEWKIRLVSLHDVLTEAQQGIGRLTDWAMGVRAALPPKGVEVIYPRRLGEGFHLSEFLARLIARRIEHIPAVRQVVYHLMTGREPSDAEAAIMGRNKAVVVTADGQKLVSYTEVVRANDGRGMQDAEYQRQLELSRARLKERNQQIEKLKPDSFRDDAEWKENLRKLNERDAENKKMSDAQRKEPPPPEPRPAEPRPRPAPP